MAFPLAAALSLGGSVIGALGSKGGKAQTTVTNPYLTKDLENKVMGLIPDAEAIYKRPYPTRPTMRAADPAGDPFASKALFQLQQARDAERVAGAGKPAAAPAEPAASSSALDTLRQEMLGLMGSKDFNASKGRRVDSQAGYAPGLGLQNPGYVQGLMQDSGLKQFYTLTPEQQAQVMAAAQTGKLNKDSFPSAFGFNPFL